MSKNEGKTIPVKDLKPNENFEKYKRDLLIKVKSQRRKIRDHDQLRRSKMNLVISSRVKKFNHIAQEQQIIAQKVQKVALINKKKLKKPLARKNHSSRDNSLFAKPSLMVNLVKQRRNSVFGLIPEKIPLQKPSSDLKKTKSSLLIQRQRNGFAKNANFDIEVVRKDILGEIKEKFNKKHSLIEEVTPLDKNLKRTIQYRSNSTGCRGDDRANRFADSCLSDNEEIRISKNLKYSSKKGFFRISSMSKTPVNNQPNVKKSNMFLKPKIETYKSHRRKISDTNKSQYEMTETEISNMSKEEFLRWVKQIV
ncbi:unnamed protein product [Moneuplotes crassus]|uniref:Uncharacterized protein n=1 Tax=Euplotes crassus TaxID=5936 RepID=A0AAD1UQS5_EUPCR|nr:unnamed protein product [Moneuplotes crassus]